MKIIGGIIGAIALAAALAISGPTGCTTETSIKSSTNAVTGAVTVVTTTNKVVDPAVIAIGAGVLQSSTTLATAYIVQHDTNDIVYLQGVQAALTLALTGTNVPPAELKSLLANVKISNSAASALAQSEMDSLATQYAATYADLVAQGIDANAVAGPLLNAILNGLNAGLVQ